MTASAYSHAALALGEESLIEAWWSGVRVRGIDSVRGHYVDAYRWKVGLSGGEVEAGLDWAHRQLGKGYGFGALVGFVLEKWMRLRHNPLVERNRVICSQFVDDCYWQAGVELPKADTEIVPGDFAAMAGFELVGTVKE